MGLYEAAKDALKDIPMADVIRERISLALERLAEAEAQIATLQTEKGGLEAQIGRERTDHEETKKELQTLKERFQEDVRFIHGVEFRRGTRTGDIWLPFCPKCHLPISFSDQRAVPYCNDAACGWVAENTSMGAALQELRAMQYPSQKRERAPDRPQLN